jgi:hypothetical protein
VLITFSGLDGAGKSTLIEWLRASLEREGRAVAVLHMNDDVGVYAYVRRARDLVFRLLGRPVPQPQTSPATGSLRGLRNALVWSDLIRRCLYPVDLVIFAMYRLVVEKLAKRVFIMDRYFYDTLVDLSEGDHRRGNRLLKRLTPTPDVPVLLDVPPERAFGRKGEHGLNHLRQRWSAYQTVMSWVPSSVSLPNVQLEQAKAALWQIVSDRIGPSSGRRPPAACQFDRADERTL